MIGAGLLGGACSSTDGADTATVHHYTRREPMKPLPATEAEWKERLTPEEYHILREKGTERAYTGMFWDHHEDGTYTCKGCGSVLFSSSQKFDSHCGWPSYFDAIDSGAIKTAPDYSHGMIRTEIMCATCGGHLGHVFDDGPLPTGLRYCVNSASISFVPDSAQSSEK